MEEESEERLIRMETAIAHLEDLVEKLNQVVTEQGMAMDRLQKENRRLIDTIAASELDSIKKNDAPPPHWGKG